MEPNIRLSVKNHRNHLENLPNVIHFLPQIICLWGFSFGVETMLWPAIRLMLKLRYTSLSSTERLSTNRPNSAKQVRFAGLKFLIF